MTYRQDNYRGFVYITTNLVNGRRYIGKRVFDTAGRWRTYLGSGVVLKRAIQKYGFHNFKRKIIDYAATDEELCLKEKFWIAFFNATLDNTFYNIASGGDGGNVRAGYSDVEFNASEKKRIINIQKKIPYGQDSPHSRLSESDVNEIILRLQKNEFNIDIAKDYMVSAQTIDDIRQHRTWRHLTDGIEFDIITHRGRNMTGSKAIVQFDKNKNRIATYNSAREAEKETGVGFRLISQVCNGTKKSAHGYIFQFL